MTDEQKHPPADVHVVPLNDLRDHEESAKCWCCPIEIFDASMHVPVWVHNSMDGRENTVEKGIVQ